MTWRKASIKSLDRVDQVDVVDPHPAHFYVLYGVW